MVILEKEGHRPHGRLFGLKREIVYIELIQQQALMTVSMSYFVSTCSLVRSHTTNSELLTRYFYMDKTIIYFLQKLNFDYINLPNPNKHHFQDYPPTVSYSTESVSCSLQECHINDGTTSMSWQCSMTAGGRKSTTTWL